MPSVVIVGAQWGDEGKGKITDYLAREADCVVRYQGGNNAGHTIVVDGTTYKFHLVPSGMLYKDKRCMLGNGVVVDPEILLSELDKLVEQGVDPSRLRVSSSAHVILPTHKFLDQAAEAAKGENKIGTTGRGIGPAYRDKVHRSGVRFSDAAQPERLRAAVAEHFREHGARLNGSEWDEEKVVGFVEKTYARLKSHVADTSLEINETLDRGGKVLLEGAQGTLLDIDHGTYPFVTSSNPISGGACIGAGVGPTRIDRVLAVAKAYTTRVGQGPFPTELDDATGESFRSIGGEFGTTTGRARRCGWIDLVALKYAVRVNGVTHLAVTKLDVLDAFETLKVCTAYRVNAEVLKEFPVDADLADVEPVYETMPGWKSSTESARRWSDLPAHAMAYITRLEEVLRVPVAIVSVGADRDATFSRLAVWP